MADIKAGISIMIGDSPADSSQVMAEIDTRPASEGGINAASLGKTSDFSPGEEVAILVWLSPSVVYDEQKYPNECYYTSNWYDLSTFKLTKTGEKVEFNVDEIVKFVGGERKAGLKYPVVKGSLKVCQWLGENLASYYGGGGGWGGSGNTLIIGADEKSVELPAIPDNWKPRLSSGTGSEQQNTRLINEYVKRTRRNGVASVRYRTAADVFKFKLPNATELEKYGKPPYYLEMTFWCKLEVSGGCSANNNTWGW